jgi:MFS family permease
MDRESFFQLILVLFGFILVGVIMYFFPPIAWYWLILIQALLMFIALFTVFTLWTLPKELRRKRRKKAKDLADKKEEEAFKISIESSLDPNLNYYTKKELVTQAELKRDIRNRITILKDAIKNSQGRVEGEQRYINESQEILKEYEDSLNEGTVCQK